MDLHYSENCLICQAKFTTNLQASIPSPPEPQKEEPFSPFHLTYEVQNFNQLCQFLKIDFPGNSQKFRNICRSLKSDKKSALASILCPSCLEMGNYLAKLYGDLNKVKSRIKFGIFEVQRLMKEGEAAGDNKAGDKNDSDDPPAKKMKQNGTGSAASSPSSSIAVDFIEFGNTFRNFVKDVETGYPVRLEMSDEAAELVKGYQKLDEKSDADDDNEMFDEADAHEDTDSSEEPEVITLDDDDEPVEVPYQNGHKSPECSVSTDNAGVTTVASNGDGEDAEIEEVPPNSVPNGNAATAMDVVEKGQANSGTEQQDVSQLSPTEPIQQEKFYGLYDFHLGRTNIMICKFCKSSYKKPMKYIKHRAWDCPPRVIGTIGKKDPKQTQENENSEVQSKRLHHCIFCDKFCKTLAALKNHIKAEHTGPRNGKIGLICKRCSKVFQTGYGFSAHKRMGCDS